MLSNFAFKNPLRIYLGVIFVSAAYINVEAF